MTKNNCKELLFYHLYKPDYKEENMSYRNFHNYVKAKSNSLYRSDSFNYLRNNNVQNRMKIITKTMLMTKTERHFQYKEILKDYYKYLRESRLKKSLKQNMGFIPHLLQRVDLSRNELKEKQVICLKKSSSMTVLNNKPESFSIKLPKNESTMQSSCSMLRNNTRLEANKFYQSQQDKESSLQKGINNNDRSVIKRYSFLLSYQQNGGLITISHNYQKGIQRNKKKMRQSN